MLSVIMVGQNILGRVSDKRADETSADAEATVHEGRADPGPFSTSRTTRFSAKLAKLAKLEAASGRACRSPGDEWSSDASPTRGAYGPAGRRHDVPTSRCPGAWVRGVQRQCRR
jgi:hypothetical protein